jgi:hypothetical protein
MSTGPRTAVNKARRYEGLLRYLEGQRLEKEAR